MARTAKKGSKQHNKAEKDGVPRLEEIVKRVTFRIGNTITRHSTTDYGHGAKKGEGKR